MDLQRWRSQLRKGAAELAVLAVLEGKERYGLEILEAVRRHPGLDITEGTIYPLLNRLQRDAKISARWVEDPGTKHPRKYYTLTEDSTQLLAGMREEWEAFNRSLTALLREEAP